MRNRRTLAFITTAVAVAGTTIGITGLTAGEAAAANPPTIQVELSGTNAWKISWNGTGAPGYDTNYKCVVLADNSQNQSVVIATGGFVGDTILPSFGESTGQVWAICDRSGLDKASTKITIYSPRNPVNDARTLFSNTTQGLFGS